MEIQTDNRSSYLSFRLGDEIFAISVAKVLEVLEIQKITRVPKTPKYMRGVLNLRGDVLPVIDTRLKFNMETTADTERTVIIVLDLESKNKKIVIGAIADSVKEVLEINENEIKTVPEIGSNYDAAFITGMVHHRDDFIMLLDMDKVFSLDEIIDMKTKTETLNKETIEN